MIASFGVDSHPTTATVRLFSQSQRRAGSPGVGIGVWAGGQQGLRVVVMVVVAAGAGAAPAGAIASLLPRLSPCLSTLRGLLITVSCFPDQC